MSNSIEIMNLKNIAEPSLDELERRGPDTDKWWAEQEKLAAEMADDDPRLVPGYHQFNYDTHTRDVIRAKGFIKARGAMAEMVSVMQCSLLGDKK